MIDEKEVNYPLEYLSLIDQFDSCHPRFRNDIPAMVMSFLEPIYAACHNYVAEHPDELDD